MSNKKTKRNKGTTLSLQDFNAKLEDGNAPSAGQNVVYASKKQTFSSNWADEMDEEELITEKERILLPSAPRSSRGPNIDDSQIPRSPPFTVHLSNVAYEIGDDDIYNFFRDMKIVSVRIPRDPGNRPKGYAYIDFDNREDLIMALTMSDQQLKGRSVRISLGEGHNRRDGGPGRGPGGGSNYSDATPSDWRSDMRSSSPLRSGGGGFNDFRRNDFGRGGDFERPQGFGSRDRGYGGGNDMTRDQMTGGRRAGFNDFPSERGDRDHFQRDRSGSNEMDASWRSARPPPPQDDPPFVRNAYGSAGRPPVDYGGMRMRDDGPRNQDNRGYYDRSQRQSSPPRGGGYDEERGRRGYNAPIRSSRDSSPSMYRNPTAQPPAEPSNEPHRERKKLVLAPRTVTADAAEPATTSAIFGGAKPVDTTARDKEIEEKLMSMEIRSTTNRVRSDSHADEPRIRILQRTPEDRDRRDRELKLEREKRHRERYPSSSSSMSDRGRDLHLPYRHSIPQDLPKILQPRRSPINAVPPPTVASSFCSENFHPNNKPPTSKHFQRSEGEDDYERTESSTRPQDQRNELVQNDSTEPLKNPWNRRKDIKDDEGPRRQVYTDMDRKTPEFDHNSEKEKDTNSDPEDDRDSHHRFINEDNVAKQEDDDDDDFHKVSRSRGRRERDVEKYGSRDDGSRGDRRGGGNRGGGNYPSTGGSGAYVGGGGRSDPSGIRRGDRSDSGGPRRQQFSGRGESAGGGGGVRRGGSGYGGSGMGAPPSRERNRDFYK